MFKLFQSIPVKVRAYSYRLAALVSAGTAGYAVWAQDKAAALAAAAVTALSTLAFLVASANTPRDLPNG
jgi:hypothetical protein